jgi:hypothetical protein
MKNILKKIFYFDEWSIGLVSCKIEDFQKNKSPIIWFKNSSKICFNADPFGFQISDKKYIIFEEYSQILKRGRIAIAEIANDKLINKKIVLDDKKHLSYPFVFIENDDIFVICEAYKSKKLCLYKIDKLNLSLQKIREIFPNHEAIDPTIIKLKDKYWLFYSKKEKADEVLYLAYANSLSENFIQHKNNPIKSCKASARSAGTPFIFNNEIYRPAQNCQNFYGEKIVVNKINILNENDFNEEFCYEISVPKDSNNSKYNFIQIHTISSFGNQTIIDGLQKKFLIYKPLISIFRNLKKIVVN